MSLIERIVGLLYTAIAGAALYYFWPDLRAQLRGTWFNDLDLVVAVIYVFAACWVLELIWTKGLGRLVARNERISH